MYCTFSQKIISGALLIVGVYLLSTVAGFCAVPYQTDMWMYTTTGWYGDNIYESPANTQKLSTSVASGSKASYTLRLQNDGNQPDTHWLTGSSVPAGWTVKLTEVASGLNITNYVLSGGWGNRATGALRVILVEVTPDLTVADNSVFNFSLTFTSHNNSAKKDTVMLATTVKSLIPDAQISMSNGAFIGDNYYGLNRDIQFTNRNITAGSTASFVIRIQNDGEIAGKFNVTGSGSSNGWIISYFEFNGGADITSEVTGAGKITPVLNPGSWYVIIAQVQSLCIMPGSYTYNGQVTVAHGSSTDTVEYAATITPVYKPDALIYEASSASYLGNDIYNNTGADQAVSRNLVPNGQTTYYVRVQNDGNIGDVLKLTGPASSGSFTITYIDSSNGNNITAEMTGAGWATGNICPTGKRAIKVIVKASASAPSGEQLTINVTAKSNNDITKLDTVSAITTIAP